MKKKPYMSASCRLAAATVLLLGGCSADPPADDASATRLSESPSSATTSSPASSGEGTGVPTYTPDPGEVFKLPEGKGWATLREGRYAAWAIGATLRYEVDVPDEWRVLSGTYINAPEDGKGILFIARVPKKITHLPEHPCRDHSLWLVGPTVDDLARAMASQPVWKVSTPRPATLDGIRATYLEVDGQRFLVMARCYDTCTEDDLDTMSAMAESIHFLPR